ncbi:MAG: hypothetical protein Q7U74_09400 [Saprospiraceae bacterium]|nr:hypothetical protein [Saprospiraceae bacterium]
MHKIFLCLLLANSLSASTPNKLFQDDLSSFDCALADLTLLEEYVQESNATQAQMLEENNPLAQFVIQEYDLAETLFSITEPEKERLLGIPGFFWGFCCSFVGMFLVYLAIDNPEAKKREGKQAILGCALSTLVLVGAYLWLLSISWYY